MDYASKAMVEIVMSFEDGQNNLNLTPVLEAEQQQNYLEDSQMPQTRDAVQPAPEAYPVSYPSMILASNTEAQDHSSNVSLENNIQQQENSYFMRGNNTQQQQIGHNQPGDPIQYYREDLYAVSTLSQLPQTSALVVQPAPEVYPASYPTTILSYNAEAQGQQSYISLVNNTQQQQAIFNQPHDFNAVYGGDQAQHYRNDMYAVEPLPQVSQTNDGSALVVQPAPGSYVESCPLEIVSYNSEVQQNVQQVPIQDPQLPENTSVIQGIEIAVLGYVNQEAEQGTQQPPKKSITWKPKKWITFTSDWNCATCNRSFKSKGGLRQHNQNIHSGPTPHRCDMCGKRFKDLETMQKHRERHLMKDKPFKCDWCPMQFLRFSDMQRHANLHHGLRRFSCSICGRAFDRADHVADHMLSHENGTVKKLKVQNGK